MENLTNGEVVTLELYLSAKTEANVEVSADGFSDQFTIQPGNTVRIVIPISFMATGEGASNKAIQVLSDEPISVYQLNKRRFSADAAVLIPVSALGREYYVTAHWESPSSNPETPGFSEAMIVATEDNTRIEVTPTARTFGGWDASSTYEITLDAGEVYQIQSSGDLTGTYVQAISDNEEDCKNIAVFGGSYWVNVGECGGFRDHLVEQMFPVSTWGENFVFVPYESRSGGDMIKIIASEDGTEVNISGMPPQTLNAGEVYTNRALDEVRTITASKPISFAQFSRSSECDGVFADPFMIIVSPIEQRIQEATFSAFRVQEINQYYLTLITEQSALNDGIFLDGQNIQAAFQTLGNFAYASVRISQGDHSVSAEGGVIAFVYGYGQAESFGYSAGVSLENLNLQIVGQDEFIGEIAEEACVNASIEFNATFETEPGEEPRFDTFSWVLGDGAVAEGQQVTHTYSGSGEYTITLTASKGNPSCGNSETFIREITILEVEAEQIQGPASVCPDVFGVAYTISGPSGNTYEWEVEGATGFTGQGTNEILVDWGAARADAMIRVTPINSLGCRGEVISLPVVINKRLEPADPLSSSPTPTEVCYLDRNNVRYFTPQTNGSEYEWFIEGGRFITNQNANEVFVDWGANTSGKIWYREFNPAISDCEGFSDTLNITVFPEITDSAVITHALCNGDANGTISLTVQGGKAGGYTADWSNGMTGLEITGLTAGDYTATIRDVLGCEITSQTYTVNEPDELILVNDPIPTPVRCFQEANGLIDVVVQGGTAPYRYTWTGEGIDRTTTVPQITDLRAGVYNVLVTDANGCQVGFDNIAVNEPLLLEADLNTLINDPVCPQAEDGIAFVDAKGGTPDYQFFWSNNPTSDDQEARNLSEGEYTLVIEDANGCTTTLTIEKGERTPKVFVPNAFSPNGDGENDEFKAVADCDVIYSLQIYNKWGAIVFSANDVDEGWDGNFQGSPAPDGKYSYVIFWAAEINGAEIEQNIRGTINIYR